MKEAAWESGRKACGAASQEGGWPCSHFHRVESDFRLGPSAASGSDVSPGHHCNPRSIREGIDRTRREKIAEHDAAKTSLADVAGASEVFGILTEYRVGVEHET